MDKRLDLLIDAGASSATFLSEVVYDFQLVDLDSVPLIACISDFVETLSVETVTLITFTEAIPYEQDIVSDDNLFDDHIEILRTGLDGEAEITAMVTYVDGERTQRTILQTKILADAVSEIIIEGSLARPPTASWGEYVWPTVGTVSSLFGPRRVSIGSSNHQGIDISAPHGTPVIAADGGEVIFVGRLGGFGNLIQIRHDNSHVTYYAHLSSMAVSVGERVYRGQFIGGVGMTGTASGNHLHFEIRVNGTPVDPMPFLP